VFSWNNWHLSLSETEHEDPLAFKPERYLGEHLWDTLEGQWSFGAGMIALYLMGLMIGRRVCVGWNIAHRNMFIVFSRLIYCFDFFEDAVYIFGYGVDFRLNRLIRLGSLCRLGRTVLLRLLSSRGALLMQS
jgi:cytochrome P450